MIVVYGDNAKDIQHCMINSNFPFQTTDDVLFRTSINVVQNKFFTHAFPGRTSHEVSMFATNSYVALLTPSVSLSLANEPF